MFQWKHHIEDFLSRHPESLPRSTSKGFELRCVICKDSEKRKFLRRGAFLKKDDTYIYACQNDGCALQVKALPVHGKYGFFATYYPEFYMEACHKSLSAGNKSTSDLSGLNIPSASNIPKKEDEVKARTPEDERAEYRNFISLKKPSPLQQKAIDYCVGRNIPEDVWKGLFVASEGNYKGRLIIPFWHGGKIVYYQGRTLFDSGIKYKNKQGRKHIYNLEKADPNRTVFAFEGVMDTFHVNNSVAFLGLGDPSIVAELVDTFPKLCFVLDDDKAGIPKMKKLIEQGKSVFIWDKFKNKFQIPDSEKMDMNKFVCQHFNTPHVFEPEELEEFATTDYWDRFWI